MAGADCGSPARDGQAALGEPLKRRIRAQCSCALCQGFYSDPVILRCGSSFCRACVELLAPAACPDCGAPFDPARLTANQNLARLVEISRQLLEHEEKREAAGGGEEAFFCKQERAVLCQDCYQPQAHQGHGVIPADLAAQEYQVHIRKCLISLKKEEKDFLLDKTTLGVAYEYHIRRATLTWERTKNEFQRMEEFLDRQKRELLAEVAEVYKEVKRFKNEQLSALSKRLVFLQRIVFEMEGATQLPEGELLKNIGVILQKFEERESDQSAGTLSLELQDKIMGLININLFMLSSMKSFRENVASRLNRHRGITTPNPNESDPSGVESEEPRPVSYLDELQPSIPGSSGLPSE